MISTIRRTLALVSVMTSALLEPLAVKSVFSGLISGLRSSNSCVATAWRSGMTCVISSSVGAICVGSLPVRTGMLSLRASSVLTTLRMRPCWIAL